MHCTKYYHLVNISIPLRISKHIERSVQVIQHSDNLHGSFVIIVPGAVVGEAHDTAEEKSDGVITTGGHWATVAEFGGHTYWQNRVEKPEIEQNDT